MRALLFTSILAAGCGASPAPVDPVVRSEAAACMADRMADPLPAQGKLLDCAGAEESCRSRCGQGVAVACVSLASVLEMDESSNADAVQLFGRGCELGSLIGCTNYGAYLLDGVGGLTADPACAVRLHERACQGGEVYGCGMFGRELALGVGIARDASRAREVLETSCAELGGFACFGLGMLLEDGHLGPVDPGVADAAFRRACETGHAASCGDADPPAGQP